MLNPSPDFWRGKRVLVTGHSGFKGLWLSLWLESLGARVWGFSLSPEVDSTPRDTTPLGDEIQSIWGGVCDPQALSKAFESAQPDVVFHLAAQPIVLKSYEDPVGTFETNVIGLSYVLDMAHRSDARVVINVTSDKCYENKEWVWPYRETDPMGGHDPYSASKGCAELVTASFYRSFYAGKGKALVSARAGNVIGGGDQTPKRIVPDIVRAIQAGQILEIRSPHATRPWQHVLEPLSGYLILAERAWEQPAAISKGWNIGPSSSSEKTVGDLVRACFDAWGLPANVRFVEPPSHHEAKYLSLNSSLIRSEVGWKPRLSFHDTIRWTIQWYKECTSLKSARELYLRQIEEYCRLNMNNTL